MIAPFLLAAAMTMAGTPPSEFIFTDAPFASAHASNLVQLRNGDLFATWFGGSGEGKPDVAIWSARRHDGHWSAPAVLVREPNIACFNPVVFYAGDGRLWFYYKFGPFPSDWTAGRRFSGDDGQSWSPVEHLPAGLYGPIRTKPLVMTDGTIVSGTSVESYSSWACWIERSTDNGKSWTRIGPIASPRPPNGIAPPGMHDPYGLIQPSVIQLEGKHLRLYMRATKQIGHICIADSFDAGLSWSAATPLDVPNPNSGIDAVKLGDGRILLAYNDSGSARTPLNLAVSRDGEHFRPFAVLEQGPGEFSYPSIIQLANGEVAVSYTWNRKRIRVAHYPLSTVPQP